MPVNSSKAPKHILVMRLSAMGDVAMIVPVLLGLVQQHPEVKVTVVSRPFFKPFFDPIPRVTFCPVDLKKQHKGVVGMYRLFKELSRLGIDAYADLHNVLRSNVLGFFFKLSGVPVMKMDKGRAEKKVLTQLQTKKISPIKTVFQRHVEVFEKLNISFALSRVILPSKKELPQAILDVVEDKTQKWIGIAPFAQYQTKVYPLSLMRQVIDELSDNGSKVLLFGGGEKEKEQLDALVSSENVINVTGQFNLTQELQLISHLDVMLSMDSGNGHMAAMLGVPVVTLWGNTHPYAGFVPFNQPLENSITPNLEQFPFLPTSVFGNKIIEGYSDCIKTISPQEVAAKIKGVTALI